MMSPNAKLIILAGCLAALIPQRPSEALLLGNFIGCNSFGCRISALESDVAQLKQQVARMGGTQSMQGMNNFRPNQMLPYGQGGMNQQQQGGMQNNQQGGLQNGQQGTNANNLNNLNNNQQQQQQGGAAQAPTDAGQRVNYALDYPVMNQNLRRTGGYQSTMNNGQYMSGGM